MGSTSGVAKKYNDLMAQGERDVRAGAEQVRNGDLEHGLPNLFTGSSHYNPSNAATISAFNISPIKGQAAEEDIAAAAATQTATDSAAATAATEADRIKQITVLTDQIIKRQRTTPGRQQTLLTPNLVQPGTQATGTLLTPTGGR